MNRGRVGEERGSKETDRCPLTAWTNENKNNGVGIHVSFGLKLLVLLASHGSLFASFRDDLPGEPSIQLVWISF
jgi:hypothetical protein